MPFGKYKGRTIDSIINSKRIVTDGTTLNFLKNEQLIEKETKMNDFKPHTLETAAVHRLMELR